MLQLKKPSRRAWWLLVLALALPGTGFCMWWGRSRAIGSPGLSAGAAEASARGDWGRVARLARERLKQAPEDPVAITLAARAAARQNRDQAAVAFYSRLAVGDLDPEDFFLMGRSLQRTGQVDAAFKALETTRAVLPDHPETLETLARLYLQNDRYCAAEEAAERLARRPDWEARALVILGTARAELEDPAGAANALTRWLQLDPSGATAAPHPLDSFRLLLARSLLKSRQPAAARAILQGLLSSGPNAQISWLIGRSYLQEGDWSRAAAANTQGAAFGAEHRLEFEPAPYVGAARCAECHRDEYQATLGSRHAATFTLAQDLKRLPLPKEPLVDPGNPKVLHEIKREGDALVVETHVESRVLRAVATYAFGARDHFMTLVGYDDKSRPSMIRMSYYESPRGSGWDVATGLPLRPEQEEEYLGKPMVDRDGVRRCLYCHTTNFRAVMDQVGPEAADKSIGCERCHGPGGHHMAAVAAGFSDLAIGNGAAATAAEVNDMCGKCHNIQRPEIISAPRTDPVWYRFQSLSLTWSRCYSESQGQLSCVTCHDPHRGVERVAKRNDVRCLSCHNSGRGAASASAERGVPPPGPANREPQASVAKTICRVNPAAGCVGCHMPRQWQQSTHSFKTDHFIRVREHDVATK
jgi:predicted CXXCH cytochrome family protein